MEENGELTRPWKHRKGTKDRKECQQASGNWQVGSTKFEMERRDPRFVCPRGDSPPQRRRGELPPGLRFRKSF